MDCSRPQLLLVSSAAWVAVGLAGCATNTDPRSATAATPTTAPAAKTHLEFAKDFKEAGDDAMYRYHLEQAELAQRRQKEAECGLLCTIINDLMGPEPEVASGAQCRDPVTSDPRFPAKC